jgi:hypothetical protein
VPDAWTMSAQPAPHIAPAVPEQAIIPTKPALFGILVLDLLALSIAFLGTQVSDDEGITGICIMLLMIGGLMSHVVYGHLRR